MTTVWRDMRTRGRPVWCIKYKGLDLKWHRERTEAQNKDQAQRILRGRLDDIAEAKLKGVQVLEQRKPVTFEQFEMVHRWYKTALPAPLGMAVRKCPPFRGSWRWRPDLNRRITVLQTVPLGRLGTPPGAELVEARKMGS
jgi:hypothetical protein